MPTCTHKLQRFVFVPKQDRIKIIGFFESSQNAYGADAYLHSEGEAGDKFLVAAKTRVAPVKFITLPKLKLCCALLVMQTSDTNKVADNQSTKSVGKNSKL